MPLVGPFGLYFAKNIVLGVRFKSLRGTWTRLYTTWKEKESILGQSSHIYYFLSSLWQFLINILVIPYNLTIIQGQWPILLSELYSYVHLNPYHMYSVDDLATTYIVYSQISEVEMFYAIPVTMFSVFLLATDDARIKVALEFNEHKKRAKDGLAQKDDGMGDKLKQLQDVFSEQWKKTVTENKEWGLYSDETEVKNDDSGKEIRNRFFVEMGFLLGSIVFSLVPRWWMCGRYGASWHGDNSWMYFLLYFVNTSGLVFRFLKQSHTVQANYHTNVDQLAVFQAISWEKNSVDVLDPMQTRNDRVQNFRDIMSKKNIQPLDLGDVENAKTWWKLREMMLLDIKDERISMEMLSVVCFMSFCGIAACNVYTTICFGTITMLSLLSTMIILVLGRFNFLTLRDACDINSMCKEHVLVLRRKILELKLGAVSGKNVKEESQALLEEFARVIEEEGETETVVSLPITSTTFVIALCILGIFGMSSLITVFILSARMQF